MPILSLAAKGTPIHGTVQKLDHAIGPIAVTACLLSMVSLIALGKQTPFALSTLATFGLQHLAGKKLSSKHRNYMQFAGAVCAVLCASWTMKFLALAVIAGKLFLKDKQEQEQLNEIPSVEETVASTLAPVSATGPHQIVSRRSTHLTQNTEEEGQLTQRRLQDVSSIVKQGAIDHILAQNNLLPSQ